MRGRDGQRETEMDRWLRHEDDERREEFEERHEGATRYGGYDRPRYDDEYADDRDFDDAEDNGDDHTDHGRPRRDRSESEQPEKGKGGRIFGGVLAVVMAVGIFTDYEPEKKLWDRLDQTALADLPNYDTVVENAFSPGLVVSFDGLVPSFGGSDSGTSQQPRSPEQPEQPGQSGQDRGATPTTEAPAEDTQPAEPTESTPPAEPKTSASLAFPPGSSDAKAAPAEIQVMSPPQPVTDAVGLQTALDAAVPGAHIVMEPGTYTGNFVMSKPGAAEKRIRIEQKPGAALVPQDPDLPVVFFNNADYVEWTGYASDGGLNGIAGIQTEHSIVRVAKITNTGSEGVLFYDQSRDNFVDLSKGYIENTGRVNPEFGEGIFFGSAAGDMLKASRESGQPPVLDQSDRNYVLGGPDSIRGTTREAVEFSEGTSDNRVEGLGIDGSGIAKGTPCVTDKGRGSFVINIVCARVPDRSSAVRVEPVPELPGSGERGMYAGNRIESTTLATGQYIVSVDASVKDTSVICLPGVAQEVLSNIPCRPDTEQVTGG